MSSKLLEIRIANLIKWGRSGNVYSRFLKTDNSIVLMTIKTLEEYAGGFDKDVSTIISYHSSNSFQPSYIRINYE